MTTRPFYAPRSSAGTWFTEPNTRHVWSTRSRRLAEITARAFKSR